MWICKKTVVRGFEGEVLEIGELAQAVGQRLAALGAWENTIFPTEN